jgi:hypothetical protein
MCTQHVTLNKQTWTSKASSVLYRGIEVSVSWNSDTVFVDEHVQPQIKQQNIHETPEKNGYRLVLLAFPKTLTLVVEHSYWLGNVRCRILGQTSHIYRSRFVPSSLAKWLRQARRCQVVLVQLAA